MINENLKQICLKREISAYRLSKLANIPISVAAKIIRGEVKNPRIDSVIKIADALDISLDELVGRKKNEIFLNPDDYIKKNEINKSIVIGTFESKK